MIYASRFLRLSSPYMKGPDVQAAQWRLCEKGFDPGPVDGIFGLATERAVKDFQRCMGLQVDGIIGPFTWSRLNEPADDPGLSITVDVVQRILTLHEDSRLLKSYPVAVGAPDTPTPLGNWTITEKTVNPGGPFGARWMRLSIPWGGYGIHGTDTPSSIGTYASHGCIRMFNQDVIEVYDLVPIGTPVHIIGGAYTGRILKEGVEPGSDIAEVQRRLQVLGYYRGPVDGVYNAQTRAAVTAFQSKQGLTPDGTVGPMTYSALQRAYDIATGNREP